MENKFILKHSKSTLDINPRERVQRKQSFKRMKFKEIKHDANINSNGNTNFNQLNSKFNLYQNGCPNQYKYSIPAFKADSILNQLNIVDSPFLDGVINELKSPKQNTLNQRDYEMYPNLLKKSYKYKDMLSDKQQIKDFINWFQESYQKIQDKSLNNIKKYHQKELLLTAGFNQIVKQLSKFSKSRSQILKMLWNRENTEIKTIIESLSTHNLKLQKQYLESSSQVHTSYQEQIQKLKKEISHLYKKNQENSLLLNGHINSLRSSKKTIKKYQKMIKKILQINFNLSKENLNLLQQNAKLLMQGRDLNSNEAKILLYRRLQLNQKKTNLKKPQKTQILARVKAESHNEVLQNKIIDLQQKKQKLYTYFKNRMEIFPDEKRYIQQEYFFDQSFENFSQIQKFFKKIINSKTIEFALVNQSKEFGIELKQTGTNTNKINILNEEEKPFVLSFEKSVQANIDLRLKSTQITFKSAQSQRKQNQKFGIIQDENQGLKKSSVNRARQSKMNVRNSLVVLQLEKFSMFKSHKQTSTTSNSSRKSKLVKVQKNKQKISGFSPIKQEVRLESASKKRKQGSKGKVIQIFSSPKIILEQNQSVILNKYQKIKEQSFQEQKNNDKVKQKDQIFLNEKDKQILEQIENILQKFMVKSNIAKIPSDPKKSLAKIFNLVWKQMLNSSFLQQKHNSQNIFAEKLLLKVKEIHNQSKNYLQKFLTFLNIIKNYENKSDLLQIVSLFLKLNHKFKQYQSVNCSQILKIYFNLFSLLRIKKQNQDFYDIWDCDTSLQKLRQALVVKQLEKYFSKSKITYIQIKMEQFVNLNALHQNSQRKYSTSRENLQNQSSSRSNKNKNIYEKQIDSTISLNSTLLYIIQVYLIQKMQYKASYQYLIQFLSFQKEIKQDQINILKQILNLNKNDTKNFEKMINTKSAIKIDQFYRICVKCQLPLFEQLSIQAHKNYNNLQNVKKQQFDTSIQISQWPLLKLKLQKCNVHSKNHYLMIEKLEKILNGKKFQGEKQIFSLIYQLLIINSVKFQKQE